MPPRNELLNSSAELNVTVIAICVLLFSALYRAGAISDNPELTLQQLRWQRTGQPWWRRCSCQNPHIGTKPIQSTVSLHSLLAVCFS